MLDLNLDGLEYLYFGSNKVSQQLYATMQVNKQTNKQTKTKKKKNKQTNKKNKQKKKQTNKQTSNLPFPGYYCQGCQGNMYW
jgi:hypothetical protein